MDIKLKQAKSLTLVLHVSTCVIQPCHSSLLFLRQTFLHSMLFAFHASCFNRPNDRFFPPVNIYEEVVGLVVEHFMSMQAESELESLRSYISRQHRRSEIDCLLEWWDSVDCPLPRLCAKVKTFKEAKISYTFAQCQQWQTWSIRALDNPRAKVEHEKAAMTFGYKIQF